MLQVFPIFPFRFTRRQFSMPLSSECLCFSVPLVPVNLRFRHYFLCTFPCILGYYHLAKANLAENTSYLAWLADVVCYIVENYTVGYQQYTTNQYSSQYYTPDDCNTTPGWVLPILGHGREVLRWWPPFFGFTFRLGPYFIPQHNPIDPLFLQKKLVCLNHI